MIRFAVRHRKTGRLFSGTHWRSWSKGNNGKLYTGLGHAQNACKVMIRSGRYKADELEIVHFELALLGSYNYTPTE
jgi:hypothetical protein